MYLVNIDFEGFLCFLCITFRTFWSFCQFRYLVLLNILPFLIDVHNIEPRKIMYGGDPGIPGIWKSWDFLFVTMKFF